LLSFSLLLLSNYHYNGGARDVTGGSPGTRQALRTASATHGHARQMNQVTHALTGLPQLCLKICTSTGCNSYEDTSVSSKCNCFHIWYSEAYAARIAALYVPSSHNNITKEHAKFVGLCIDIHVASSAATLPRHYNHQAAAQFRGNAESCRRTCDTRVAVGEAHAGTRARRPHALLLSPPRSMYRLVHK
jgi:hypothetical protein